MADIVENYPGFPSISGLELMDKYRTHAQEAGVEAKALIIATGANPKHLNVPGEKELISKGVSYCAICDGPFFKNKTVVVVGGGNSAVADALLLSKIAQKVYLVHRRDCLRAAKVLQDRAKKSASFLLTEFLSMWASTRIPNSLVWIKIMKDSSRPTAGWKPQRREFMPQETVAIPLSGSL